MGNLTTTGIVLNVVMVICALIGAYLAIDLYSKRLVTRGERRQVFSNNTAAKGLLRRTQTRLTLLDVQTSAYDFVMKVVIQSLIIGAVIFIISLLAMPSILAFGLAFIVVFASLVFPFYTLDGKVSELRAQREFDLPRFFKMLIALMKTHIPYKALQESVSYTPISVRPFVEQLIVEIEQMPTSSIPFENFADNIGVDKARNFMTILHQSMHVSPERSIEFLENLKKQSDMMEDEAVNNLAQISVGKIKKYKIVLFLCILISPLSIVAIIVVDMFKNLL